MNKAFARGMTLRLELFVNDLAASIDFYRRVLEFNLDAQHADGYILLTNGEVQLGLNRRANLPHDHPIQAATGERLGRGVEIVLEVDDVATLYERVLSRNWPLSHQLQRQPWGLTDFRIVDPDGYYLRVTSRGLQPRFSDHL